MVGKRPGIDSASIAPKFAEFGHGKPSKVDLSLFLDSRKSHFITDCLQDGPWRSSVVPGCSLNPPGSSQNEMSKETKSSNEQKNLNILNILDISKDARRKRIEICLPQSKQASKLKDNGATKARIHQQSLTELLQNGSQTNTSFILAICSGATGARSFFLRQVSLPCHDITKRGGRGGGGGRMVWDI
jgi:hypothetical protein